jgi:anti-anti-sigma factor
VSLAPDAIRRRLRGGSTRSPHDAPVEHLPVVIAEPPPVRSTCRISPASHLGIAVYSVEGQLDAVTAPDAFVSLSAAVGRPTVLLDLSGVTFLDAHGVTVLRDVIRRVHGQGGLIAIARPWHVAKPVLELVGMGGFVYLAVTAAGAIGWLGDLTHRPGIPYERATEMVHEAAG